jgi:uncharacterized protein YecE (DUF72 family)
MVRIATAAWSVPGKAAQHFATEGSGLSRYASVFDSVEINSTFYRRHRVSTFERWACAVPACFRFAVKVPKMITHTLALRLIGEPFRMFLDDIAPLGHKLGPLLCQLPPTLIFDTDNALRAFGAMRSCYEGPLVVEPRHLSWGAEEACGLLRAYRIERVLADPAPVWPVNAFAAPPAYIRLHGQPKIYHSSYTDAEIAVFAALAGPDSWCVFDNTASGAAVENALTMQAMSLPLRR